MVFKLVRTDSESPFKIQLPLGTHLIGRGKFLDVDDKRVSRKHGQIKVVDDSITIKALHQNPCFYTKKGSKDIQILSLNGTIELNNEDKFGLLPDTYWYEVIYCSIVDGLVPDVLPPTQRLEDYDETTQENGEVNENQSTNNRDETADNEELLNLEFDESAGDIQRSESPSLLPVVDLSERVASPSFTQRDDDVETGRIENGLHLNEPETNTTTEDLNQNGPSSSQDPQPNAPSPSKRSHSPEQPDGTKKAKTEDEEQPRVKVEPDQAGPSGDQGNAGNVQPQVQPPNGPGRERCMYGANCYRKNPAHKAQFSHPTDPDWGAGERGVCPWGAGCRRRDPRHFRDHQHPDGFVPGGGRPPAKKKKQRQSANDKSDSESEDVQQDLIVTGKRTRKAVKVESWSGSEDGEDPFQTDDEDEWVPGSQSQSQYSQDD